MHGYIDACGGTSHSSCDIFSLQMINPVNYTFTVLKTQGKGTEDGPVEILDQLVHVGATYTDNTNKLMIVRISQNRILVIFRSGLSFELGHWRYWANAQNIKIPQEYAVENQSRGVIGSTPAENFDNKCELFLL